MAVKPAPRKARSDAIPDQLIAKALQATSGRMAHAALKLGLAPATVQDRIKLSPYLQAIKEECLQLRLDTMEKNLDALVEEMNLGAICFGLKTLGKQRGYTESTPIYVSNEMAESLKAAMNQMAAYQEAAKIAQSDALNIEDKSKST